MDGVAVVNIRNVPLNDPLNRFIKRLMDIVCSLIFIVLFSPIMLVAAIAVLVSSPGPILFKQKRVGFHNKEFNMYKFRSMVQQKQEDEKKGWTTKGDARVTKVGAILRKTSVDELPQFFNVLFGTMSIVGPRPERKQFVEQFMEEIPRYNVKHQVRPGDKVRMEVTNKRCTKNMVVQSGKAFVGETLCAQAEWMCLVGKGN